MTGSSAQPEPHHWNDPMMESNALPVLHHHIDGSWVWAMGSGAQTHAHTPDDSGTRSDAPPVPCFSLPDGPCQMMMGSWAQSMLSLQKDYIQTNCSYGSDPERGLVSAHHAHPERRASQAHRWMGQISCLLARFPLDSSLLGSLCHISVVKSSY